MQTSEQGARRDRHHVIPRTLIFVTRRGPLSGEKEMLLIKGAASKRLWANKYNGLGGHVEAGEDLLGAAQREMEEEAGLRGVPLALRGVIHIDTGSEPDGTARPGVMVFVFVGESQEAESPLCATSEGAPEWVAVSRLAQLPLVDDLYTLLPRLLGGNGFVYGNYLPAADGRLSYHFHS